MAKIDMAEFDEMESLLKKSDDAKQAVAANAEKAALEPLILESFTRLYNILSEYDTNNIYLKGHRTKIKESNFIKLVNAIAPSISRDEVLLLRDTTMSGSDEGMIITGQKIFFKKDKAKGEIGLRDIASVYTKRAFFGNTVDITDKNGNVWRLGQVVSLKDALEALDDGFSNLIRGMKTIYNE